MTGESRTPVSDELRLAVFRNFGKRRHPNVLCFEIGASPGEIVFSTTAGRNSCYVTEDKDFVYFEMASGTQDRKTPKNGFLKEIGFRQTA